MHSEDIDALNEWFQETKRDFPWREDPNPYRVWISEVMLQQTQASVVVGYFERWMAVFPNIGSLAAAPLEQVLKLWEGLGYYSRARHLHEAAQSILKHHQGILPSTRQELEKIKGLGPYTIGAILSFAFHQKSPAVDGNVSRVIARFFLIEADISQGAVQQKIRELTEGLLPDTRPWVTMEALIELGAQVCTRIPQCSRCPLRQSCLGFRNGMAPLLPIKKQGAKIERLVRTVAVVMDRQEVLLRKGEKGKVMADLYEFPYIEDNNQKKMEKFLKEALGIEASFAKALPKTVHSFTRYKAELYPSLWNAVKKSPIVGYEWVDLKKANELPFSAGHKRILNRIDQ